MAGEVSLTDTGDQYSSGVGFIFIFNLIVGTGALTMPHAFQEAGWLISLILVVLLGFSSYITVTFMVEAMATANALRRWKRLEALKQTLLNSSYDGVPGEYIDGSGGGTQHTPDLYTYEQPRLRNTHIQDSEYITSDPSMVDLDTSETSPLLANPTTVNKDGVLNYYDITERVEMGQMASMFFNKSGVVFFHLCMAIYLYGDMAIYAAAVPKSLRNVICTHKPIPVNGTTCNRSLTEADLCWNDVPEISRMNAYRICLAVFALSLGGFVFFNVQKTKYLQIFTTLMRWLAFLTMIILAIMRVSSGAGEGKPVLAKLSGIPTLFGVCVYSFMCHHSLPSLTSPIRDKSRLLTMMSADYLLILVFYSLLSFTGIFAFNNVQDLYTLNFLHDECEGGEPITNIKAIQYFLALFPVFTISTNFPIIGITLRNNLKSLCLQEERVYPWLVDRLLFPLVAIIPPLIIAMVTNKVDMLVSVTGSYAGTGIQYVIPACLVLLARRQSAEVISSEISNTHASPFKHKFWVYTILVWAVIAIIFVTANHILVEK